MVGFKLHLTIIFSPNSPLGSKTLSKKFLNLTFLMSSVKFTPQVINQWTSPFLCVLLVSSFNRMHTFEESLVVAFFFPWGKDRGELFTLRLN